MSALLADVPVIATCEETAEILKLSPRTVWQMGKDGLIKVVQIGRSRRYCLREFLFERIGNEEKK